MRKGGVVLIDAPGKIGAAGWIPIPKRKRDEQAKGEQEMSGTQDRIVGRAWLATYRRAAEAFALAPCAAFCARSHVDHAALGGAVALNVALRCR